MNRIALFIYLVLFLITSTTALALVDYSGSDSGSSFKPKRIKNSRKVVSTNRVRSSSRASRSGPINFSLASGLSSVSVKQEGYESKVRLMKLSGHFQTPYSFFVDVDHWYGSTSDEKLAEDSSNQSGNPTIKLGFNWFNLGDAKIDIIGGLSLKSSSELASQRTDQIVGIETSKRIMDFMVAFGFELTLTGHSKDSEETDIGNIQKIKAGIGWAATQDIRFLIEGASVKISESSNLERKHRLSEQITYSYIEPKLSLILSPIFDLELGALFRTNLPKDTEGLVEAKLWNQKGIYGNSLNVGVNIAI